MYIKSPSLTTADIQKFYNKIKKEGRVTPHPLTGYELADTMVRKVHMILHQALDVAVKERLIVRNPTVGTTIPKKTYVEKQVLGDSQLDKFMEAIKQEPYWNDFFYVEIMTGLRRGEICGLKWSDINFAEGTLCIKRSVGRVKNGSITIGETKTTEGARNIILPPSVLRLKKGGRLQYADLLGKELSDRMVRSCHARIRSALEKAIIEKLITRDPSTGCKLPPKKSREMKVLTSKEIGRFLARAKEEGYYEMFLLELSTGMRRGELLGLKWSDLNLTSGVLKIFRQVVAAGSEIIVQSPKTKTSTRAIVLLPYMLELLSEMKKEKTCEWIFPSPVNIGEPRNPSALYKRFQLLLERSGCKKIRFHDLRHTFATMALENGMDVKTLSDMIGHISAETMLNIYSHITDTMRAQASVKIDRKIGGTDAPMPEAKV